jgi:hypothetical protein
MDSPVKSAKELPTNDRARTAGPPAVSQAGGRLDPRNGGNVPKARAHLDRHWHPGPVIVKWGVMPEVPNVSRHRFLAPEAR